MTNTQRHKSKFQGCRSIGNRYPIGTANRFGKLLFKKMSFLPGPVIDLPRFKHPGYCLDFIFRKIRPGGKRLASYRTPPINGKLTHNKSTYSR